jgi:predicted RNA-binding protein YlxR (DUF448 family)
VITVEEVGMRNWSPGVTAGEVVPPGATVAEHAGAGSRANGRGAKAAPRRMCVVCRATGAKRDLHRIVRSPDGVVAYDPTGKAAGRGAYLCGQPSCLDTAVRRRSIQRALKVTDTEAANAAVEALRDQVKNVERAGAQPAARSSDDEEVRSG